MQNYIILIFLQSYCISSIDRRTAQSVEINLPSFLDDANLNARNDKGVMLIMSERK